MSISNQNNYYYSGGLAEFVSKPSNLTYSFFSYWFMGSTSVGKAMEILNLPYSHLSLPLLEKMSSGEVMVNLKNEEKTLYRQTIFSYALQHSPETVPSLHINYRKLLNPFCLIQTALITKKQSEWIAFSDKTNQKLQNLLQQISSDIPSSIHEIDHILTNRIWPVVIAIGLLSEFYYHVLKKTYKTNDSWNIVQEYINGQIGEKDWFFLSLKDQEKVHTGDMTFEEYMSLYGMRADNDYELCEPRWHEIPQIIKKRISKIRIQQKKDRGRDTVHDTLIQAYCSVLLLRSEAKKQALLYINGLRQLIIQNAHTEQIGNLARSRILTNDFTTEETLQKTSARDIHPHTHFSKGKGVGVSKGNSEGEIFHISDSTNTIPKNAICIFPNASPQFSQLYPKCSGLIFLKGGQTSHGAIVAREFGIPAIIAESAKGLISEEKCVINGTDGSWEIVS